jgi:hypothetical protein
MISPAVMPPAHLFQMRTEERSPTSYKALNSLIYRLFALYASARGELMTLTKIKLYITYSNNINYQKII